MTHRATERFLAVSGVQLVSSIREHTTLTDVTFSSQIKSKVGHFLTKIVVLRI